MVSDKTKGFRDHPPSEAATKQRIKDTVRDHAERYGYQPLETPVIEHQDLLTSKFTGGEEILKEMYTLTDRGERALGLRYDLTVPFARFVAEHPELKKPFKRYQSGTVYRDGPIKHGRYRAFEQFDLDIVGSESRVFDAELITIIDAVLSDLDIPHRIEVNTRGLLEAVIGHVGIPDDKVDTVILTIDKYEKIGRDGVEDELGEKGFDDTTIQGLLETLHTEGGNEERIDHFETYGDIDSLKTVHEFLDASDVSHTINPYLARGLTYYTGTVFEAFPTTSFDRSIAAGGRYDSMVADLSEHHDSLPGVGASFGVDTLLDCMDDQASTRDDALYVVPMMNVEDILPKAQAIRGQSVNTMLGDPERSFSKHMEYADKEGFGYLLVIGSDEQETGEYTIKHLKSGTERTAELDGVANAINELEQI